MVEDRKGRRIDIGAEVNLACEVVGLNRDDETGRVQVSLKPLDDAAEVDGVVTIPNDHISVAA